MLKILINGESKELDAKMSLSELLIRFSLPTERIAVEINQVVVRRKDWDTIVVKDSDTIEIVHFVGGG